MYEFIQSGELKAQAKRLLGYRTLLVVVILMNTVMVLRVPMGPPNQAIAQAVAQPSGSTAEVDRASAVVAADAQPEIDVQGIHPADPAAGTASVAVNQIGGRDQTDLSVATNSTLSFLQTMADYLPSELAQNVSTWAGQQLAAEGDWQPTANQLFQDWLQSAPHLTREETRSPGTAPADCQPENVPAIPSLDEGSGPPRANHPDTVLASSSETNAGPPLPEPPLVPNTGLTLVNPQQNNGVIRFLIDRRLVELQPGEAHQFPPADSWVIQFHPGGDFDNVQRTLSRGTYEFHVTGHGWELTPPDQP